MLYTLLVAVVGLASSPLMKFSELDTHPKDT